MTDEQLQQILRTLNDGYKEALRMVLEQTSADHDLLIRIDAKLEQYNAERIQDRDTISEHIAESVMVRDKVRTCSDHINGCQAEQHSQKLQYHDTVIGFALRWGWVLFLGYNAAMVAIAKAYFEMRMK